MKNAIITAKIPKRVIACAGLLLLTACATTPEPEPVIQTPPPPAAEVLPALPVAPPAIVTEEPPVQVFMPAPEANLPIPGSAEDFAYQSGGDTRIYFAYDQYDLSMTALDVLRRQASWLNTYTDVNAVIEGNADERGTREYNLALGGRRANSVKDFLVSQGVRSGRLTTISFGKERPIDPRSNTDGWAQNRNSHTNISVLSIAN